MSLRQQSKDKRPLSPAKMSESPDQPDSPVEDASGNRAHRRVNKSVSFHQDFENGHAMADDGGNFFGTGGTPPGDGYDCQESPGGNAGMQSQSPLPDDAPFSPPPPADGFPGFPGVKAAKPPPEFDDWTGLGDRYELSKIVGSGSYGKVAEAFDRGKRGQHGAAGQEARKTAAANGGRGTRVAIKQCQNVFGVLKEAKQMYRELHILRKLNGCPQIITLLNVLGPNRPDGQAFKDLYLVFEWADMDVHKLIHSPQYLSIRHVQSFAYQLLKGVKYMQSANVIHRDLKPANILVTTDCQLKICDFGLSRVVAPEKILHSNHGSAPLPSISSGKGSFGAKPVPDLLPKPVMKRLLTTHVVTRWYRCPELILLEDYTSAVDMWSVGCIIAELLDMLDTAQIPAGERRALFPGRACYPLSNDHESKRKDQEQLTIIFDVLGTPTPAEAAAITDPKARTMLSHEPPRAPVEPLSERYDKAPAPYIKLLEKLLRFDPRRRASCEDALADPVFFDIRNPADEPNAPQSIAADFDEEPTVPAAASLPGPPQAKGAAAPSSTMAPLGASKGVSAAAPLGAKGGAVKGGGADPMAWVASHLNPWGRPSSAEKAPAAQPFTGKSAGAGAAAVDHVAPLIDPKTGKRPMISAVTLRKLMEVEVDAFEYGTFPFADYNGK